MARRQRSVGEACMLSVRCSGALPATPTESACHRMPCLLASPCAGRLLAHISASCLPACLPRRSNVAEFNRGDLFVIRYRAVQQLVAEGAVELV